MPYYTTDGVYPNYTIDIDKNFLPDAQDLAMVWTTPAEVMA